VIVFGDAIRGDSAAKALPKYVSCIHYQLVRSQFSRTPRPNSPHGVASAHELVASFMHSALYINVDKTTQRSTVLQLSNEVLSLWEGTAKRNREIYTEVFTPVPLNLMQNWQVLRCVETCGVSWLVNDVCVQTYAPKVNAGHVVPEISLDCVKKQLSQACAQSLSLTYFD
jgi:phospholipase D1/2